MKITLKWAQTSRWNDIRKSTQDLAKDISTWMREPAAGCQGWKTMQRELHIRTSMRRNSRSTALVSTRSNKENRWIHRAQSLHRCAEKISSKILTFPSLETGIQVQEVFKILHRHDQYEIFPQDIKSCKRKKPNVLNRQLIRVTSYFLADTIKARKTWLMYFKAWNRNKILLEVAGLDRKWTPKVHMLEHWFPCWWYWFGGLWKLYDGGLCWRG